MVHGEIIWLGLDVHTVYLWSVIVMSPQINQLKIQIGTNALHMYFDESNSAAPTLIRGEVSVFHELVNVIVIFIII